MRTSLTFVVVAAIALLPLALMSCGGGEEVALPEATVEEAELDVVEVPEVDHALITFVTGEAYIQEGDGWVFANIGDYLEKDAVFRVDIGYAELQFGDIGTARVQEGTTISLSTIAFSGTGAQVDVKLIAGNVLNKVETLAANERYEVRTETAVMGVRGTEFGVRLDENQETRVAVREGAVGVLPATADPQRLQEKAGTSARANAAARVAAKAIEESAPVVEANQELLVNEEAVAQTVEVVRQVEERIVQIAEESPEPEPEATEEGTAEAEIEPELTDEEVAGLLADEDIAELVEVARQTTRQATEVAVAPAREISEASRQELEQIDEIRVIHIPQRAEEDAETEPEPPPLIPIVLEVEPADALISLDGRELGRGRFQGIFLQGEVLEFSFTKDGHVSKDLRVEVQEARGRSYSVKLPEIPRPEPVQSRVQIDVEPSDATIFVNGEEVGTRRIREEFEVGAEILIRAELDGYRSVEQVLTVAAGRNANQVEFSLERILVPVTITVEPDDAAITVNGEEVGVGSFDTSYPLGTELGIRVERYGFDPDETIVQVEEGMQPVALTMNPAIRPLEVVAAPGNAAIFMNGEEVGFGSAAREFVVGTEVELAVALQGYYPQESSITVEEENEPLSFTLERIMGTLTVDVQPSDAEIVIDGSRVGTGAFEREYPSGTTLQVELRKAGFAPLTIPVTIQEGANQVSYTLAQDIGSLRVNATPGSAEILINGVVAGTGSVLQDFPAGQTLDVEVRQQNYVSQTRTVTIEEGDNTVRVSLERQQAEVAITTQPSDSRIEINGSPAGLGSITRAVPLGDQITVTVARPGYATTTERIRVSSERVNRSIRLEPQPIEADISVGTQRIIRRIATDGDAIFSSDAAGAVRAHSLDGRRLWEVRTDNGGNENSRPTVIGGNVVFTGSAELVVVDGNGRVSGRRALGGQEAHLFGRRAVGWNGNLLLPTDGGLAVLDGSGGDTGRFIQIDGGSKMTPAVVGNAAVLADLQGTVRVVDLPSGTQTAAVVTGMNQPVAHAPAVNGSTVVMAGRRGTIVAVDAVNGSLLWEDSLASGSAIFVDPVIAGDTVFFFTRNQIEARSLATGAPVFAPIADASTAPVVVNGVLYYGAVNGMLMAADASTGRARETLRLPARASAAAVEMNERIVLGLENGHVVVVHPDGL